MALRGPQVGAWIWGIPIPWLLRGSASPATTFSFFSPLFFFSILFGAGWEGDAGEVGRGPRGPEGGGEGGCV